MKMFSFTKPYAATLDVWGRWQSIISTRYPKLYYLREVLPSKIRVIFRKINDAIWWVRYRTTHRYHDLKIKNLKPGYHDVDHKILYVNFSLLMEYVEIGLSSKNHEWHDKNTKGWFKKWKSAEAGLNYIDEMINDEDIKSNAPNQIEEAMIVRRLYLWWTVERNNRIETYSDPRIWEGVEKNKLSFGVWKDDAYNKALHNMGNSSTFYEDQDQKMLEKLISIRCSLWS